MQIYDHNGDADVLEDTMENTSLLLKVDGKDYPVRSCALKTVLERARREVFRNRTVAGHFLRYLVGGFQFLAQSSSPPIRCFASSQ